MTFHILDPFKKFDKLYVKKIVYYYLQDDYLNTHAKIDTFISSIGENIQR